MADQKRNGPEGRVIEFAGGVFTDMPVNERPCEYLENLLPPMGGGKGLEPRDGIDFVVRLWPPYEGDTDTHIYDVYNPDDMTQTHLIACYNVDTNEIVHLTTHTDQEGRKSIPPLGGGSLVLTPIAVDDLYFTTKEVTLEVEAPGVMSNDEDLGEDATVSVVSQPLNGTVTLNPDGSFEYQPLPDFVGLDSFTYIITSLGLTSNVGRVVVSVGPAQEGTGLVSIEPTIPVLPGGSFRWIGIVPNGAFGKVNWVSTQLNVISSYSDQYDIVGIESGEIEILEGEPVPLIPAQLQEYDPLCEAQYFELQLQTVEDGPALGYPSKISIEVIEPG